MILRMLFATTFAFTSAALDAWAQQPIGERGAIVVHGPPTWPDEPTVTIEVDGRAIPDQALGQPLPYTTGRKHVRADVRDATGRSLVAPRDQIVWVHPGKTAEVHVPPAVSGPDSALLGGGIAITTLGLTSIVGSGMLFTLADAAGEDCHADGWAEDACGYDPGPFLGWGATTLLFGLAGIIGGPVMIAEGAEERVRWLFPEVEAGPAWGGLRWRFY